MALLGTYIDAGAASLTNGLNCFSHSLPSRPDFATWQYLSAGATAGSLPISLESRANTVVIWRNPSGDTRGEHMLIFAHSVIR